MDLFKELKTFNYSDKKFYILDQRLLPEKLSYFEITDINIGYNAIKTLAVRGAPAIGVAAAYIALISMKKEVAESVANFKSRFNQNADYLISSRPTAVNLSYTVNRLRKVVMSYQAESSAELLDMLEEEAERIEFEDINISKRIGWFGNSLIKDGDAILTHCNAGLLATSKLGTALAPIYMAVAEGKKISVYADETRPLFQGSRLTAYELIHNGIDTTILADNMAASLMAKSKVDLVIVGCDRVAKNGDTANKIGTLSVAINAKYFRIPFYVALPSSTYDRDILSGKDIPIEERDENEIKIIAEKFITPKDAKVYNPAFDITPYNLITAFVTDKGIIYPPFEEGLKVL